MSRFQRFPRQRLGLRRVSGLLLLGIACWCLHDRAVRADLAAELEELSQQSLAESGRDALVRAYGKALVRHPTDPARSRALVTMGHLCENNDPAHGYRKDEERARKYFRAGIAAAPIGSEAWLKASLTSFSREIWCDQELASKQLVELERQFAKVAYYDPDWRRVAAVQVASARVDYAKRFDDTLATIDAFRSLERCERAVRPVQDPWQNREIALASERAYSEILGKIVFGELPKARRRELLESFRHYSLRLPNDFQQLSDLLDSLPEARTPETHEPVAL